MPIVLWTGVDEAMKTGGIVKAEGFGDGLTHTNGAIAKLRLTLPPTMWDDFAFALPA